MQAKNILNNAYGVQEDYLVDNHLCKYNSSIYSAKLFEQIDCRKYSVIFTCINEKVYPELKEMLLKYFSPENIFDIAALKVGFGLFHTKIGKYSSGPICRNHSLIESIGSFCSFAAGVEAVPNHEMKYITTHAMIYGGQQWNGYTVDYSKFVNKAWYFPGVQPQNVITKRKRSVIGNDVWLGRNVLITNGADIGNGVIAGAGAVITKAVPDYAVVCGVPARVIRFRYSPEQIEALNRIAWWDWSDDEIRERYDDFYLPIEQFVEKYI